MLTTWIKRIKLQIPEDQATRRLLGTILLAALASLICFWFYNRVHTFDDYSVSASAKVDDIDGTQYRKLGENLIKYSTDGVFCVDLNNEIKWSQAYTMQTPICDMGGKYMVIAEQQGTQVYTLTAKEPTGNFKTELPIISAHIAENGVTALVLGDKDVTWINLYQTDGTLLASVKSTVKGTGYPLDVALSSNAKKMMVSFLGESGGALTSRICFYDFSSNDTEEDRMVSQTEYQREIFPDVSFVDGKTPVAISDAGFVTFSTGRKPAEKKKVEVDKEIVSTFYDEENIGFIYHSKDPVQKYDVEVYNYHGKKVMASSFNYEYENVKMENGEILINDPKELHVYRTSGKQKLNVVYKKEVNYFAYLPGYHKYLVITDNSLDQIRIS